MLKQGTLTIQVDLSYKEDVLFFDNIFAEVDKFIKQLSTDPSVVYDDPKVTLIGEGVQ